MTAPAAARSADHPLRRLRHARHWSIEELSRRSGIGGNTIVDTELAHRRPKMATRRKLLRALGLAHRNHRGVFGALPGEQR